jgi:2-iminoacetate synthase ThiH
VRADRVGDTVTYVVNRNLNFTNICYTGCRFCAFAQRRDDPDAYTLSLDEVADRAQAAWDYGATEVCLQGGIHPDLGGDYYFRILDAIKARVPDIHIHAYSPMEVVNGAARLGISIAEFLTEARRHGLDTIPLPHARVKRRLIEARLSPGRSQPVVPVGGNQPDLDSDVQPTCQSPTVGHALRRRDPLVPATAVRTAATMRSCVGSSR